MNWVAVANVAAWFFAVLTVFWGVLAGCAISLVRDNIESPKLRKSIEDAMKLSFMALLHGFISWAIFAGVRS